MTRLFNKLTTFTFSGKEKAAAGFLAAAVGSYLVESGMTLDQVLTTKGLKALVVGVVTHQLVYWSTNSGVRR